MWFSVKCHLVFLLDIREIIFPADNVGKVWKDDGFVFNHSTTAPDLEVPDSAFLTVMIYSNERRIGSEIPWNKKIAWARKE